MKQYIHIGRKRSPKQVFNLIEKVFENDRLLIKDSIFKHIGETNDNNMYKFTLPDNKMMTEFTLRVSDIENLTELYYIIQKDTQIYVPDLEKPYIESHISFPDQNPPAPKNVLILDSEQLKHWKQIQITCFLFIF